MNISTKKQFSMLNQELRKNGCKIDTRFYFFTHFYYCLVNDRKLLLEVCKSSHLNGSDLWQKLSEIFMYISLSPCERMQGAPEVSYYKRFDGLKLRPIVFNAEMRSLIITLAQKHYDTEVDEGLNNPYMIFAKELVNGGGING